MKLGRTIYIRSYWLDQWEERIQISTRGHQIHPCSSHVQLSSVSLELTSLQVNGATAQRSPGSWLGGLGEEKLASREDNYKLIKLIKL